MRSKLVYSVSMIVAILALPQSNVWATVTAMTGGDSGEGLTLVPANVVLAINVGHLGPYFIGGPPPGGSYVLQGVTFQDLTSATDADQLSIVNVAGGSGDFGGLFDFAGSSANDVAAENILRDGYFSTDGFDVTISGLAPSTAYKLDLLLSTAGYGGRTELVTFGGFTDTVNLAQGPSAAIDTFDVVSSATGEIVGTFRKPSGDGPVLNGLVVSAVVPEPNTL